jgi:hypothetical protein
MSAHSAGGTYVGTLENGGVALLNFPLARFSDSYG